MYKIQYENKDINFSFEFKNLSDIFNTVPYSKVEKTCLETIFNNLDYGINILKPLPKKDDYLILYASNTFWQYFNTKLPEQLPGCLFNKVICQLSNHHKINIRHNSEGHIKLYENNDLIKFWSIKIFIENGLIYIKIYDKTYNYVSKNNLGSFTVEKDYNEFKDLIIGEIFDIVDYGQTGYIIKADEGYYWTKQISIILELPTNDGINFSKENILYDYAPKESINKLEEAISKSRFKKPEIVDYEIKTAKNNTKFFRSYIKLVKRENKIYQIIYTHDITNEYLSQKEASDLQGNINTIMDFSKIAITVNENGINSYTPSIYDILEIDNPEDYPNNEIINDLMFDEDSKKLNKLFESVTPENPEFYLVCRYTTGKGNLVYISGYNKAIYSKYGELIRIVAILQDVTNEKLAEQQQ